MKKPTTTTKKQIKSKEKNLNINTQIRCLSYSVI